jgi:4-carboxymuconolactone decarboxylase
MPTPSPYDLSARAAAGREVYARNFGLSPAEAERLMTLRAGPVFTREAYEVAGGPGWQSKALTDRDRSIAVIAALVSQGVTDERLATYLSLARRNGVDTEGLIALMVLLSAYLGQPHTSLAADAVQRSAGAEQ